MTKPVRLGLTVIILAVSVSLLIWGYSPNPRETRVQTIDSAEMQLP